MYIYIGITGGATRTGSRRIATEEKGMVRSTGTGASLLRSRARNGSGPGSTLALHDIVITNIVWCMAYKGQVRGGVVYCPIVVQSYCNSVGNASEPNESKDD